MASHRSIISSTIKAIQHHTGIINSNNSKNTSSLSHLFNSLNITSINNNQNNHPSKLCAFQLLQQTSCMSTSSSLYKKSNNTKKDDSATSKINNNNIKRYSNPRLRTHAISILQGDYNDYDDDDDTYDVVEEAAFPEDDYEEETEEIDSITSLSNIQTTPYEDPELEYKRQRDLELLNLHKQEQARRAKWIENAKTPIRIPQIDPKTGRSYGRGGRKTATARVWIQPGEGLLTINRREFLDYFPRDSDREMILSPFVATNTCGKFDVIVAVEGGGLTGKAGAVRHGIARALEKYNPAYRPPMKRLGFMTRDSRMVERKKVGLKKARRAPQWVRR